MIETIETTTSDLIYVSGTLATAYDKMNLNLNYKTTALGCCFKIESNNNHFFN